MNDETSDDFEPVAIPSFRDAELGEVESMEELDETESSTPREAPLGERRGARNLWLISYSDFMTILMIFFLAMYGYTYLAKMSLLKRQPRLANSEFSSSINKMKEKLGSQISIQNDVDKLVLQMSEQILFASGSSSLSPKAGPALEELANSIKLVDGDVIVSGHTDDVPLNGKRFKSNWELSAARAFSVIEALTSAGVPPERLSAWGFGENRPIVPNTTAQNRGLNRRIEVAILKKKLKK